MAKRRLYDLRTVGDKTPTVIKEIFDLYQKDKQNKKNDYMWRVLSPYWADLRPDQVTRKTCREYRVMRNKSNGTILRELSTLRAALRWFDANTPAQFEMPQAAPPRHDYLKRDEVLKLLQGCAAPHIKLYIILSIATAARKTALLELKWNQIDFERGLIDLGSANGNKKRAIVPMNSSAEAALEEAYKARLTDYVIEFNGKRVKDIKKAFGRTVQRSGLEKHVNPHMLRHTSAVWMAENRVPMSEISQYLGHANTLITERVYARYSPEYLKSAASSLEIGFNCTHSEKEGKCVSY